MGGGRSDAGAMFGCVLCARKHKQDVGVSHFFTDISYECM